MKRPHRFLRRVLRAITIRFLTGNAMIQSPQFMQFATSVCSKPGGGEIPQYVSDAAVKYATLAANAIEAEESQ